MQLRKSWSTNARFAVESKFIGQFAWFYDYSDAVEFLEGLEKSNHENHWNIVELN